MTTYTIFANANDGHVQWSSTTYSEARGGGGSSVVGDSAADSFYGQRKQGSNYRVLQNFNSFDCSVIDAGETVSAALLNQYVTTDNSDTDFTAEARDGIFSPTLGSDDFIAGDDLSSATLRATLATSSITESAYNTFTDVAMIALVDAKSSTTDLCISSSRQRTGDAPTGIERVTISSADETGTTQDPYLDVTAAAAGTEVSASTDALTLTEQAASISLDVNVPAGTDALTLTEQAASISLDGDIAAGVAALALTEFAATVNAETNVQAAVDALTLATFAATIGVSTDVEVSASVDALTLTTYPATVNAETNVQAGVDALTLTANQAAVSLGITIAANVDALTLTEQAASINAATNVLASAEALTLTPLAAVIGIGTTVDRGDIIVPERKPRQRTIVHTVKEPYQPEEEPKKRRRKKRKEQPAPQRIEPPAPAQLVIPPMPEHMRIGMRWSKEKTKRRKELSAAKFAEEERRIEEEIARAQDEEDALLVLLW